VATRQIFDCVVIFGVGDKQPKGGDVKNSARAACGLGLLIALSGCATNDQGQAVIDTDKVNQIVGQLLTPPAAGNDSADKSSDSASDDDDYTPEASDKYVRNVSVQDIQVVNGDTYVMVPDANGKRHRVFYGHGDLHADVMARHAQLQRVIAHNGGNLPNHPVKSSGTAAHAMAQNGRLPSDAREQKTLAASAKTAPGMHTVSAPVTPKAAPAPAIKPAVATKSEKTDKKTVG
jgi:hypothetical protein